MNNKRGVVYPFPMDDESLAYLEVPGNGTLTETEATRLIEMVRTLILLDLPITSSGLH